MAQMGGNVILAPLAARNPMVEDLDGNGYAILDLDRVETNALLGTISEKEIQQLDGAGLYVDDDGRLRVNSDVFDGDIEGLSNPLTEDLDAAGYNIENAFSVTTEELGRGEGALIKDGSSFSAFALDNSDDPDEVSSDSFQDLQSDENTVVYAPLNIIPDGATLFGNFYIRPDSVPDDGAYRPRLQVRDGADIADRNLDELSIEVSSGDGGDRFESGFKEITSFNPSNWSAIFSFQTQGRVDSGTLESREARDFGLILEWRVD